MVLSISSILILLLLLLHSSSADVTTARLKYSHDGLSEYGFVSKEQLIAKRARRKKQMLEMVRYMRKQLADHSYGIIQLDPKGKADIERRIDIFSRKVETMVIHLDDLVSLI